MNKLVRININEGIKTSKRKPLIVKSDCCGRVGSYFKNVKDSPVINPQTAPDVLTKNV